MTFYFGGDFFGQAMPFNFFSSFQLKYLAISIHIEFLQEVQFLVTFIFPSWFILSFPAINKNCEEKENKKLINTERVKVNDAQKCFCSRLPLRRYKQKWRTSGWCLYSFSQNHQPKRMQERGWNFQKRKENLCLQFHGTKVIIDY